MEREQWNMKSLNIASKSNEIMHEIKRKISSDNYEKILNQEECDFEIILNINGGGSLVSILKIDRNIMTYS